ncbi:uncharacterized protein A4U43_C09F10940 [Asparagus officinalis]|uniref:Uncharacterized protein n=1 Tax=Asparagus officinalis TaxID=4686 RepID=A0A5P1E9X7_ASPOF|nr:uncharacterized protein A4U43_C09F10940 [Asparagus officinalis]
MLLHSIRGVIVEQMQMPTYTIFDHAIDFTARPKRQQEAESGPFKEEVIKKARQEEAMATAEARESHETSASELTPITQSTSEMAPTIIPTSSAAEAISTTPVIVMEIALPMLEVKASTAISAPQFFVESAIQVAQPTVSEGNHSSTPLFTIKFSTVVLCLFNLSFLTKAEMMEATITISSMEREEEEEEAELSSDSEDAILHTKPTCGS